VCRFLFDPAQSNPNLSTLKYEFARLHCIGSGMFGVSAN
jgi:hypothetical protein